MEFAYPYKLQARELKVNVLQDRTVDSLNNDLIGKIFGLVSENHEHCRLVSFSNDLSEADIELPGYTSDGQWTYERPKSSLRIKKVSYSDLRYAESA
jgi:hypothetical protein